MARTQRMGSIHWKMAPAERRIMRSALSMSPILHGTCKASALALMYGIKTVPILTKEVRTTISDSPFFK